MSAPELKQLLHRLIERLRALEAANRATLEGKA